MFNHSKISFSKKTILLWLFFVLCFQNFSFAKSIYKTEPTSNLTTWVYEEGSFVPSCKITERGVYSIISDYLGRPTQAFDKDDKLVWSGEYDIYGKIKMLVGNKRSIPFRQLGQYEDFETELYYNRYRYYDFNTGAYISRDPIELEGNNLNLYAYVWDSNNWIDVFGLSGATNLHHTIPREIYNPRSGASPLLPSHLANDPDIIGKPGNPNRWSIPQDEHIALHKKNRVGGDYNTRWKQELNNLETRVSDKNKWTKKDILDIRDKLTKEFGIDKYKPKYK